MVLKERRGKEEKKKVRGKNENKDVAEKIKESNQRK